MSSTRKAKDPTAFHQSRYASSSEFEPGLIASLVARRCSVLDNQADRELIWWLHYLSHQEGGLKKVAAILVENYGTQFGPQGMVEIGKTVGQNYTADEVKKVRSWLPPVHLEDFPLRGEIPWSVRRRFSADDWSNQPEVMSLDQILDSLTDNKSSDPCSPESKAVKRMAFHEAEKHPNSYPVATFLKLCQQMANEDEDRLDIALRDLCLDPAKTFAAATPWYFHNLISTLRTFCQDWMAHAGRGVVVTALGREVHEVLDFTLHSQTMTLLEGDARTGKTFAARLWCEQHPGHARFIEVPTGNDDAGFFRALARGLGLGNFTQYKASELRERVECVLLTGDILICLDEAHRLWPEMNARYGFPKRINWLMSMANQDVPICLVATPQFLTRQKAWDKNAGWNSAQFLGRLGDYKRLPGELSVEDLMAVSQSILPEVDKPTVRALAAYARTSARYLAAVEAIAKRARFVASRDGRSEVSTADVRDAMSRSIIPSDSALVKQLEKSGVAQPVNKRLRSEPALVNLSREQQPKAAAEPSASLPGHRPHRPEPELVEN